ncbi:DUF1080 domain-containing protein [candidate division KSB1 bacterium]
MIYRTKNLILLIIIIIMSLYFFSCSSSRSAVTKTNVDEARLSGMLSRLPAGNLELEKRLTAELIGLGPDYLLRLCEKLLPPGQGDDAAVRFALNGLTRNALQAGGESGRSMYSNALLTSLEKTQDREIKAFLIRQLQQVGGNEAVKPLGKYLSHENLYEPAAMALFSIGGYTAEMELINALSKSDDKKALSIIKILGDMKSKAAGYALTGYAMSENKEIREMALYALANIGPFTPDALLAAAAAQSFSYIDRSKAATNQLLYAQRLAESGMSAQCADLCRDLIRNNTSPENKNVQIAALTILQKAVGEDALWDLIRAMDSPDKDVRISAMETANRIPGTNTTIELFNKMKASDPEIQLELQSVLRERDKQYLTTAVEADMILWVDEEGFRPLFNGKDLTGWKGLVGNPLTRAEMSPEELAKEQEKADELMRAHWKIEDGVLVFDGEGSHLCTERDYGDFEMKVDWKIGPEGDSGIYLRGSPQVQIWDTAQWPEGSGGLYNNQKNPAKPLAVADNPIGEWNSLHIKMVGDMVTVYLNNILVVDNVVMENYWDRDQPIFPRGQIELQSHGSTLYFKNVRIKELDEVVIDTEPELEEGFVRLFNGEDLTGWVGDKISYIVEDGKIVVDPARGGGGGNLYTENEYQDFVFRFEFRLTPGANNGLGIRAPLEGDAAYVGMELQILDNTADIYADLKPWQYHGSVYGIHAASKGYLKSVGSWNSQEVIVRGRHIIVNLNDVAIVDVDLDEVTAGGTIDGRDHPGLNREKGHIGFLGHGSRVEFRNLRIREINR